MTVPNYDMISPEQCSNVTIDGVEYNTFTEPPALMAKERAKTNFPVREMTYFLFGGKKETEQFEAVKNEVEKSPAFDNRNLYDTNVEHEQCRVVTMKKVAAIAHAVTDGRSEPAMREFFSVVSVSDPQSYTRIGVHFGLFLNGIRSACTPEQFSFWVDQGAAGLRNFFGCFCMTELGHGSNVAGMETTATYDESSEEFIINTPTTAATKWWIGGAAHTATHGLVYARLIVKGKDYGVKQFVVPLRSRHDWTLLPGVAIGDIGKKMGRDGIDNGWVQFNNVRIPRLYMCAKYNHVSADGKVTQKAPAQLSYGALIGGRVSMVGDSWTWASRFLTIALRYACVRRQFAQDGPIETTLIDYTYHQRRLLPRLAYTYAMNCASRYLDQVSNKTNDLLASTNPNDKASMEKAVGEAKALFALSAGLKAFSTWGTLNVIEECRQACGGHGYSAYNGFIDWNAFAVQVTWEGDNNVLALSTGRALIGRALKAPKVSKVSLDSSKLEDPEHINAVWKFAADKVVEQGAEQYNKFASEGLSADKSWEQLSQLRFKAARVSTRSFVVNAFFKALADANPSIKPALLNLSLLFALWSLEEESSVFLEAGALTPEQLQKVNLLVNDYCAKVREQVIGYTDSFNWSDFFINAPIGYYNGDVYRNYFNKVVTNNPVGDARAPYYSTVQEPFFKRPPLDEPDLSALYEEEADNEA